MAGHSRATALADLPHAVEAIEGSPDRDHDSSAGCREANPKGPTLEYGDAKLILQADDASADRRGVDAERFGSTRKTAGFDHDRQIAEIHQIHCPVLCWRKHSADLWLGHQRG